MKLNILVIVLILSYSAFGQRDRWNGLIIDESTSEDAIKLLGSPISDKLNSLKVQMIKPWLSEEIKNKKYRHLEFKNIKEFSKVKLAFFEDKLVFIQLEPAKNLSLGDIEITKELKGRFVYEADDISGTPGGFPKLTRPRTFHTDAGRHYKIGTTEKTFLVCLLKYGIQSQVAEKFTVPIYVDTLQIVSRKLEVK